MLPGTEAPPKFFDRARLFSTAIGFVDSLMSLASFSAGSHGHWVERARDGADGAGVAHLSHVALSRM